MKASAIVHVIGNLGGDATLKSVGGSSLSSFSVAVSTRSSKGESTTWYRVDCWGKQAEAINQYLTKGKQVYVVGQLTQEEFTDRDGNKRSVLQVKATEISLLGSKQDSTNPEPQPAAEKEAKDDIPF